MEGGNAALRLESDPSSLFVDKSITSVGQVECKSTEKVAGLMACVGPKDIELH